MAVEHYPLTQHVFIRYVYRLNSIERLDCLRGMNHCLTEHVSSTGLFGQHLSPDQMGSSCVYFSDLASTITVTKQIGLEDDELFVTTLTTKNHYLVVHPT